MSKPDRTLAIRILWEDIAIRQKQAVELFAQEGTPEEKRDQARRADNLHSDVETLKKAISILENTP